MDWMKRVSPTSLAGLACLYAGMLLGVSFIAVPAKFLAESIELPQALDVGRHTFHMFGWVELACAAVLGGAGLVQKAARLRWVTWLVLGLVILQIVVLRTRLDARIDIIMSGGEAPPSPLHTIYWVLDATKIVLLLIFAAGNRPGAGPPITIRPGVGAARRGATPGGSPQDGCGSDR